MDKVIVLDIETENTGYDIMNDNKRIISIQTYDGCEGALFYDGSENNAIEAARSKILSTIEDDCMFAGFNIRNFDALFMNKFLGIKIPDNQILEISEMAQMGKIRGKLGKKKPRLADICKHLDIDCSHKNAMDQLAVRFRNLPEVLKLARDGADKWVKELGWGQEFSYNYALDKIAGGMAILDSFNEFVKKQGDSNLLFYKYAMGDVITEHKLLEKLQE